MQVANTRLKSYPLTYREIKHHPVKVYGGVEVSSTILDLGECSASRACRFISENRAPSTNWIGGWLSKNICGR
jgi:hypothetical protein